MPHVVVSAIEVLTHFQCLVCSGGGGKRLTCGSIYMYFITLSVVNRILKRSTSSLLVKFIFVKIKKYL